MSALSKLHKTGESMAQHYYPSVAAFTAAAFGPAACPDNNGLRDHIAGLPPSTFNGDIDMPRMRELLVKGWPKGAVKFADRLHKLKPVKLASIKRRPVWSDQGDELNRDKVYSGHLETAWRTCNKRLHAVPPGVRVVIDSCTNAGVDAQALYWRAAAGCKLAENLIQAGYNVEIAVAWSVSASCSPSYIISPFVVLKSSRARYSAAHMAACCHPGFFRMIGFHWLATVAQTRLSHGLGFARAVTDQQARTGNAPSVVFIAGNTIGDEKTAQAWIEQQTAALAMGKQVARKL